MPPLHPSRTSIRPSMAPSNAKARQVSHLTSQLAQLQANLADLEDIARVTAVQAENIKVLGSLNCAMLMAASKVLGETGIGHGKPSPAARGGKSGHAEDDDGDMEMAD